MTRVASKYLSEVPRHSSNLTHLIDGAFSHDGMLSQPCESIRHLTTLSIETWYDRGIIINMKLSRQALSDVLILFNVCRNEKCHGEFFFGKMYFMRAFTMTSAKEE
jgi:hypothetical protein